MTTEEEMKNPKVGDIVKRNGRKFGIRRPSASQCERFVFRLRSFCTLCKLSDVNIMKGPLFLLLRERYMVI